MSLRSRVAEHYRSNWGVEGIPCVFPEGPVRQLPADFVVLKFQPRKDRSMWTFATCGMAQPGDPRPIELHIFAMQDSFALVELLVVTAHCHRAGQSLGLGHSVNFGRPWLPHSNCSFGLISLPYLDGPALEHFASEGIEAKCYWLIPISASEVAFKRANGLEALEDRFEARSFDYLDPHRLSVA